MPDGARQGAQHQSSIFLTGATGFIGRRILQRLLDDGWSVRVLVRRASSAGLDLDRRAERIEGSLGEPELLRRAVGGSAVVINCAGAVRGASYRDFAAANVEGVENLCAAMAEVEPDAPLLHFSSLAATAPELSDYARSKRKGERVLEARGDLCWTVFRPPAVYGPGDKEMRAALRWARRGIVPVPGGNPHQRLSMLHVDDLVAAVVAWLEAPQRHRQQTYELDDGKREGYDWYEFAAAVSRRGKPLLIRLPRLLLAMVAGVNQALARLTGRPIMLSPGKVRELTHPRWVAQDGTFAASSGWQPVIPLAQGVSGLFES